MSKYLISFPSAAMVIPDGELGMVSRDARAHREGLSLQARAARLPVRSEVLK